MNTKEIYINGSLLELDEENNPIQLVYSINDLAELKDRQAYSTNTFKVPKTIPNLLACGFPDDATLIQQQPYRKNTAKIVQNGIEILPNAIAIIDATDANINIQILSGLIGFFDSLGDKKISDLDLSAYDHIWNLTTVANSQTNTEGYIYPVIDYGGLSKDSRLADVRQLRPATFRKTIIEKIVSEAGYSLIGNALTYEKYLKTLVAFTNDKFTHGKSYEDFLNTYLTSARKTTQQFIDSNNKSKLVLFQDDFVTDQYNQWVSNIFTSQKVMKVKISVKYNIVQTKLTNLGGNPEFRISIQKYNPSTGLYPIVAFNTTTSTVAQQTDYFNDQQVVFEDDIVPGDKFIVWADLLGDALGQATLQPGASVTFEPISTDVTYGSDVQLSATLPDISQKNFFKDFLQNFGLIAIPNPNKKEILLINMEEVYNNKPIAEDITDKLINEPDKINYSLNGYGINNYGKYKEDDAVADGLGDGLIVLDNQTLDDNVTLFTSVFSASQTVAKQGLLITEIKKIENIEESSEFKVKTQPRILLDAKASTPYSFTDNPGVTLVGVESISLPLFAGLEYSQLFEENYPEIERMLYRPFVLDKPILLKEIDVANINWSIPVYDKKTASYYYKNSIKYIQNGISSISLVRMP